MSHVQLRRGDRLPTVAALQIFLNTAGFRDVRLRVDGVFGPRTQAAVQRFQRSRLIGPTGTVDIPTWNGLIARKGLAVVDAVDITDPSYKSTTIKELRKVGGLPIVTGEMCDGVQSVIGKIREVGDRAVLLRFHGHGSPGWQGISYGSGVRFEDESFYDECEGSGLDSRSLRALGSMIRSLRPFLVGFGSIELHGCAVAKGRRGTRLLQQMATLVGVPVSAGTRDQYDHGAKVFRFEGPVRTAFPRGHTLRSWSRGLPEFYVEQEAPTPIVAPPVRRYR